MPTIKLISSDGKTFEVDLEIAKKSPVIKSKFDELAVQEVDEEDDDEDDYETVIYLEVNAAILKKVYSAVNRRLFII